MSTERADHVTMAWRTNGCRGILFAEIFELNWYQLFLIQVLANTGSHLGHFSQVSWSFLTTALRKKKGNFKIYYRRVFCSQRSRTSGICQFSTLRPQRLLVGNFLRHWESLNWTRKWNTSCWTVARSPESFFIPFNLTASFPSPRGCLKRLWRFL